MTYQLREDLSFCEVDGTFVFLDVANDRYFQLPESMKQAFSAFLADGYGKGTAIDQLVGRNILVEAPGDQRQSSKNPCSRPCRSALEQDHTASSTQMLALIEVLATVHATWRHLRKRSFKIIIDDVVACRARRSEPGVANGTPSTRLDIIKAAVQFNNARRYVPIETSCLLDSLSLIRFLSHRRLWANVVFGVTLNPFSAHCWVQADDVALNETVSDANVYTPIRVV